MIQNRVFGLWIGATSLRVYPKYQVKKRGSTTVSLTTTTPYAEQVDVAAVTGSGSTITNNIGGSLDGNDVIVNGFSGRSYGQFAFIESGSIAVSAEL